MQVKFLKLNKNAITPKKSYKGDAGFDLTAVSVEVDKDNEVVVYHTGLCVEIPEGHVGLLFPRSSIYKKSQLQTNAVGVIDSGYRGEILVKMCPRLGMFGRRYEVSDRIGQLIVIPIPHVEFVEVESLTDLSASDRGQGGYGSSGK